MLTTPTTIATFDFNSRPIPTEGEFAVDVPTNAPALPPQGVVPNAIVHWFKLDFGAGERAGEDVIDTAPESDVTCWKQGVVRLEQAERPLVQPGGFQQRITLKFKFDRMQFECSVTNPKAASEAARA